MQKPTLKLRFALVLSTGALALVVGIGTIASRLIEADLRETISAQQLALVERAASDLDEKLKLAEQTLATSAAGMSLDILRSAPRFETFYTGHPALLRVFDELLVVDPQGTAMAGYPPQARGVDVDRGDLGYLQQVLKTRRPVISEPMRARGSGRPVVHVATPVLNARSEVQAVMIGVLALDGDNFLGGLSKERIGETGYFVAITDAERPVYLIHPRPDRILQPVALDQGPALRHMLAGSGSGVETTTVDAGTDVLVGHKALVTARWILAAVTPTREAFASIARARTTDGLAALAALLLAVPLVWALAWALLRPLTELKEQVEAVSEGRRARVPVGDDQVDEVAAVARAFNAMLDRQRETEALRLAGEAASRRLVEILETSTDFVATTDAIGKVTYLNAAARAIVGLAPDADVGHTTVNDYFPPRFLKVVLDEGVPVALKQGIWHGETAVLGPHGEVPIDHMIIAHRDADHRLVFYSSVMHDVSQARAATAAIRSSEARMLAIADAVPDLVSFIDRDYRFVFVNSAYEQHFGVPRPGIVGKTIADLVGDEWFVGYRPMLERAATGETVVFERESHAGLRFAHFQVKIIPYVDEHGALEGFHLVHQDITDHKVEQQRLANLARIDPLTGLLNRAGLDAALVEAMQRSARSGKPMALLFLDIDHFKPVNDAHGHLAGDMLLRAFAARLVLAVRAVDAVARVGGDEFVVVTDSLARRGDAAQIARKICRAMRAPFEIDGLVIPVTTSIGVANYRGEATAPEALMARADTALYRAKNAGRDRVMIEVDADAGGRVGREAAA